MRTINAIPLKEVNGVAFGMKRNDVRNILGEAKEFKKSKFSKITTDDFGFCHVFYNANDECEAIEVFDSVDVLINGEAVVDINSIKCLFSDIEEDSYGFISKGLSIGIYAPDNKIESILFGRKGYYE